MRLHQFAVTNRSGSALDAGLAVQFSTSGFKVHTLDASSSPDATDVTTTVQARTAITVFTTDLNDGFLIQARIPFNIVFLNVSTAAGGSPVFAYEYYNGTSYTTLTTISAPTFTAAGETYLIFQTPHDWAVGTTSDVGGDSRFYSVRVYSTTAPTTTECQVNRILVSRFLDFYESLPDNGSLSLTFDTAYPLDLETNEALLPYFSTANAANLIRGFYEQVD
jgi:hypothetical protein